MGSSCGVRGEQFEKVLQWQREQSRLLGRRRRAARTLGRRMDGFGYKRVDDVSGIAAIKLLSEWASSGMRLDSESRGFWLMYELLTGSLTIRILMDDSCHSLGALLTRLCPKGSGEEVLPLLRLLENERGLSAQMPKYKDTSRKGMAGKIFKGKVGKGMPEEIGAALQERFNAVRAQGGFPTVPPLPQYTPPAEVSMPPLRELRRVHRSWLALQTLDARLEARRLPPPFDRELGAHGAPLVLSPVDPSSFVVAGAARGAAAAQSMPTLAVGSHRAAQSVVARRMLKRLGEDAAWLSTQLASQAQPPRLGGFEGAVAAPPTAAAIAAQEGQVDRLLGALQRQYSADTANADALLPKLLAMAGEGGGSASESQRRARALALGAGSEHAVTLPLLARMLMSESGEAELRMLNPLLSEAEAAHVLLHASGLLLTISRIALSARACALAARRHARPRRARPELPLARRRRSRAEACARRRRSREHERGFPRNGRLRWLPLVKHLVPRAVPRMERRASRAGPAAVCTAARQSARRPQHWRCHLCQPLARRARGRAIEDARHARLRSGLGP